MELCKKEDEINAIFLIKRHFFLLRTTIQRIKMGHRITLEYELVYLSVFLP